MSCNQNKSNLLNSKIRKLKSELRKIQSGLVALSGGVDSCVLLVLAAETTGFRPEAATVVSPAHPASEMNTAIEVATQWKVPHMCIHLDEMNDPRICMNDRLRCYYCKFLRYEMLVEHAGKSGLNAVLDGSNADDQHMDRPGIFAIRELGIQTPLLKAGLTKEDIRHIAREKGLTAWNQPSTACYYTRIPTGEALEPSRIERIAKGESVMKAAGFASVRLRDHNTVARIELPPDTIRSFFQSSEKENIVNALKALGYQYVCIDAEGYKTGTVS